MMTHISYHDTVVCQGCGVEIAWAPVLVDHQPYCCRDCAEGRPCECDYPPEEERSAHGVLPDFAIA
jgi:hypothetical protein